MQDSDLAVAISPPILSPIIRYYERTGFDYRYIWMTRRNLAYHFGFYDEHHTNHRAALENSNQVLARVASVKPGDRVLDAGCGLGGSSMWLAAHAQATVIGVTPVQGHVQTARRIALKRRCSDRVQFVQGDYCNTGLPESCVDVVWALESVCHATAKETFYREAARVLRPGGRLVVAEYMRKSRPLALHAERLVQEWLSGWAIPDLDTTQEHLLAAHSAGFVEGSVRDFTPYMYRSSRLLFTLSSLALPFDAAAYKLGLRCKVQHYNVVASRLQYLALQRGYWFYGVLSAVKK